MKAGAQDYLVKGRMTPETLRLTVDGVIEKAQLRTQLQRSEERLKIALEATRIGIWEWNILTGEVVWSQSLELLFGLAPGAFAGTYEAMLEQVHPDDLDSVTQAIARTLEQRSYYQVEYRILQPNGSIHWVTSQGRVFDNDAGKPVRMIGATQDISDRKQTESALRQAKDELELKVVERTAELVGVNRQLQLELEERQRAEEERKWAEQKLQEQAALLDIATDAIFVQALNNQILFWNKGAEHLYDQTAESALGKNISELLYKDALPQLKDLYHEVVQNGKWQGELHQVTTSGKKIIVNSRWTLVRDEQEKPKAILVVNTDITQKKQLEAQFLRAQRLESIGTLASGIAHDLNNILTPILASAQLLQLQLPNANKQHQQYLKTVETNAKRGAALVKQVLSFARGVEGKRTILQVRHLLLEIKQIIQQTFPKSIEVDTAIPQDLWLVSADATQLHQVLMNLCVNARDAMLDGGTLSLFAENIFIDETYARMNLDAKVGPFIGITVSDTGTGIPPEIVERIFEPFFTTKELGKGTGLGLSTVMGILKSHGGYVSVYSEVGKGTQFKVFLPAVEATETPPVEELEALTGQGELMLVVDDEAPIREITKATLEAYNYRVLTANEGIEAISLYAQHKDEISVVLTDMMMPSMNGQVAIRILQRINPQVKIIALSGLASNDKVALAAGVGVKAFLSKPYTARELLNTINDVLKVGPR
jgi:PAS domain S-box-containing protein